jgi:hypothetical protein
MTAPIRPRVREDLAVVEIDGEAVVYDEHNDDLHHLNPTATVIFGLFDGTATIREMSKDISEAFEVPAVEVEMQVRALLRQFRKVGLMTPNTSNGR